MSTPSLTVNDTLPSVSTVNYGAHIKSSLKPNLWCKYCKKHNLMFIQYFPLDAFKTLTCTECCHSRIQNDPQPYQLSKIDSGSKQVFTSSENPGNPGDEKKNEQKYVQELMKFMKASVNAANAAQHTTRQSGKAKKKNKNRNTNNNNNNNSKNINTTNRMLNQVGSAAIIRTSYIGIPKFKSLKLSYVTGAALIGNGTLGAANGVYFANAAGTNILQTPPCPIPVAPSASDIGASYILGIFKFFRRVVFLKLKLHAIATQSSTTNNMTLTIAPIRGPPSQTETSNAVFGTGTAAVPYTQQNLLGFNGNKTIDSFESATWDLTPYIAGGSGAKQNEYAIGAEGLSAAVLADATDDHLGVIPTSFVVAGNSTVTALQGSITHLLVVEIEVDLLDFNSVAVGDPIG